MSRVAHLTTVHNPQDPRIFWKECQTLKEAGYDVHLVAQHEGDEVREGVQLHALAPVEGRYRRLPLLWQVYRRARALEAELYHFHDPELIPVAYALKRATGAAVVYDMHENYRWKGPVEGRLLRVLERWCFQWADHVVVANEGQTGIPAASGALYTHVANYARPLPAAVPKPTREEGLRVVYAGVLSIERGLLDLIDLAARMRQEGRMGPLELAGVCYLDGDRRRAERHLEASGAGSALVRSGWDTYLPWSELMTRCCAAHVGIILWQPTPHHLETVPTKFYQYLQAGLPILCSDFPRWRRFVEENRCGAVVPPGDVEAAFGVLKRWAADREAYERLAANARAAAPKYRWEVMGERLLGLYRHLL